MSARTALSLVVVALVFVATRAAPVSGTPVYAIHRIGSFSPPGDFVRFDTDAPGSGQLIGNVGLGNVGTMDFRNGELWAVSGDNDVMSFHTIDPESAQSTLRSTFDGPFGGTSVFSGSFDEQGNYWVVDFVNDVIRKMDPIAGVSLQQAPIETSAGYNGVAFVGDTLYAVRGGLGDPPQQFGILDPSTGNFAPIGRTFVGVDGNGGGNGTGALDYDPLTDTLYLVYRAEIQPGQFWSLYTVDLGTGNASFVGEIRPERNYDAFAVVPEPTSFCLLTLGTWVMLKRRSLRNTRR